MDVLPTVHLTVRLCLGLLDPRSGFAEALLGTEEEPELRTLFFAGSFGARDELFAEGRAYRRAVVEFRWDCPDCGGRPTPEPSMASTVTSGVEPGPFGTPTAGEGSPEDLRLSLERYEQERAWERQRQERLQTCMERAVMGLLFLPLWAGSICAA